MHRRKTHICTCIWDTLPQGPKRASMMATALPSHGAGAFCARGSAVERWRASQQTSAAAAGRAGKAMLWVDSSAFVDADIVLGVRPCPQCLSCCVKALLQSMHALIMLCTVEGTWGRDSTAMQQEHQRGESRARDGTETECTGTTPWARACRLPAHCLRATLQQGAREPIWLTPGPLSKGPVGVSPAPLACP